MLSPEENELKLGIWMCLGFDFKLYIAIGTSLQHFKESV